MQQNIARLKIAVYDVLAPNVLSAKTDLFHDLADFRLSQCSSELQHFIEIQAIAVIENHVYVLVGFDCLVQLYTIWGVDQIVDLNFLLDRSKVLRCDVFNVEYFTSKHLWILKFDFGGEFGFAHLAKHTLTQHLLHVNQVPFYESYLRFHHFIINMDDELLQHARF